MITIEIDTTAAAARLEAVAPAARACAADMVAKHASTLLDAVRANLPAGPLRDSLRLDVRDTADGPEARIASDVAFARITEYGGRVAVPAMAPVAAKVLAFHYEGKMVFAKHTRAHAVEIPARPYLAPALAGVAPQFRDDLRAAMGDIAS